MRQFQIPFLLLIAFITQNSGTFADETFEEKVDRAIEKSIRFLKSNLNDPNNQNPAVELAQGGGQLALVLHALLSNDVRGDDPEIQKALDRLREIEPNNTYVVGLQTAALCKANQAKDARLIKRNIQWLLEAGQTPITKTFRGWSYTKDSERCDLSNSQYAIIGLHTAHRAGFDTDPKFWKQMRDTLIRWQGEDAGWPYIPGGPAKSTNTMSCAGLYMLLAAEDVIGPPIDDSKKSIDRGLIYVTERFLQQKSWTSYYLYSVGRVGVLAKKDILSVPGEKLRIDWYREGAKRLLDSQKKDGSFDFPGPEGNTPLIGTSLALLFLGSRP
jgi:hypothetical protein